MTRHCWYCGRALQPRYDPQVLEDGDIDHDALTAAGQLAIPIHQETTR